MEKLFFTDLDGTLLEKGELSEDNKKQLEQLKNSGVETIITTGKGFARLDNYFQQDDFGHKILENGAKILTPKEIKEINIEGKSQKQLLKLLEKLKDKINFLFFYDSKLDNKACFYINENAVETAKLEKFKVILENGYTFSLKVLKENLQNSSHNIGLLNININADSLEELDIEEDTNLLKIVFNEGMLNISSTNKGAALEDVIKDKKDSIREILIAGNDFNDIPMYESVIKLISFCQMKVGFIFVGDKLEVFTQQNKDNEGIEIIEIDEPKNIHLGINKFFTN